MSKIGSLYKWVPMAAAICLSACNDDDKNNNQSDAVECLELTASTTDIELDGDRLDDVKLTFEWTPAREMPEEYMISYVTKIDIEGKQFLIPVCVMMKKKVCLVKATQRQNYRTC